MGYKLKLNKQLLKKQNVSKEAQREIEHIHGLIDKIVKDPEHYLNPVKDIEDLEYKLQALWNFKIDKKFHTHRFRIKDCTCPILDNAEIYGSGLFWSNKKCKWHGLRKPKTIWSNSLGFVEVYQ